MHYDWCMRFTYGRVLWSRFDDDVYQDENLPLSGVEGGGGLGEFLTMAGEHGWELCSTLPFGFVGTNAIIRGTDKLRKITDPTDSMMLIFKRAEDGVPPWRAAAVPTYKS